MLLQEGLENRPGRSSAVPCAATSSETPTTSGPATVVWPLGLEGPVYLTIGWAPPLPVFLPVPPAPAVPNRATDLEGTEAR